MIIEVKGKRSFQVLRSEVLGDCREVKDSAAVKICYLDPGFEYDVKEEFGKEMLRRYPMDFAGKDVVKTYVAPAAEAVKVEEQPKGKKKKG